MNLNERIDGGRYNSRLWGLMLAGCAARFTAERSAPDAVAAFLFWTAVFSACWLLRAAIQRRSNITGRAQQVGNVIAMGGLLLFLLRLNSDGMVPALLTLLFALQAAMFVAADKRLHLGLILGAAFGGLMFAAAESRSPLFLPCAVWFTFAALGLLALDHRLERARGAQLQVISASAGSGGFLYAAIALLLAIPAYLFAPKPAGLLLGGMQATAAHDYREEASLPPISPPDSEAPYDNQATSPGNNPPPSDTAHPDAGDYGDEFDIENVQRTAGAGAANAIVLYAKSSHPVNLRGKLYDTFGNNRWSRSQHDFERHELQRGQYEAHDQRAEGAKVQQTIEVVANLGATLVHAPDVQRLRFPGPVIRRYEDGVFEAPRMLRADTAYSVESRLKLYEGRYVLADAEPLDLERYLDASAASERLRSLALEIAGEADGAVGRALALEHHLRTQYAYSYETISQQGYTPLDWFLFEGRRGHCEFFASALAMMLRSVGVPSRVATGFSLGEPNPLTGYYEVRALDGHAWVEAYIRGVGWLMLEPTPFYPLPRPEHEQQIAEQMDRYLERLAQTSELLDPESLKTQATLAARAAWQNTRRALREAMEAPRALGWRLPLFMLAAVVGLSICYLAALALIDWRDNVRLRRTLETLHAMDERRATVKLVDVLQDVLASRGRGREEGWTLREYAGRLVAIPSAGANTIDIPAAFISAFEAARYGAGVEAFARDAQLAVAALVRAQIDADAWPRLRRTLASWRRMIRLRA